MVFIRQRALSLDWKCGCVSIIIIIIPHFFEKRNRLAYFSCREMQNLGCGLHPSKKRGSPDGGSREGSAGDGSATAAAAGEQEDDEDDPDPVVVVEDVAQTVVHSVPPKDEVVDSYLR